VQLKKKKTIAACRKGLYLYWCRLVATISQLGFDKVIHAPILNITFHLESKRRNTRFHKFLLQTHPNFMLRISMASKHGSFLYGPGTGLASLNSDQAVISPKQSEFMYREQTPFGSEDGSY